MEATRLLGKSKLWIGASPPRSLAIGFALIIAVGMVLLKLPVSVRSGHELSWLDAAFTAASATCVTGLTVVDTGVVFSSFGDGVILALVQVGGLGFMTIGTLFAFFLRRKVSLKERLLLQEALNQGNLEGIVRLVRKVILYALTIEAAGSLLYALRFMTQMSFGKALGYGVFHSVSVFNNAGFDLFGEYRSMAAYVSDPFVNTVSILLILLGGLGFVVLADLVDYPIRRRLSLHSKIALSTTLLLSFGGAAVILIYEYTNENTFGALGTVDQIFAALLHSVSPRSAGISTLDVSSFRQATQFLLIWLMFIGASPGSTGGGIKTTTFAVLVFAVLAVVRGKTDVVIFRSRIERERVYKAITVTLLSLSLILLVTMILSITENHMFMGVLFEVTSAFTTSGLSMGLTPDLSPVGKMLIMGMMYFGRVGPLTLFYAVGPKPGRRQLYRYAEGKIIIG